MKNIFKGLTMAISSLILSAFNFILLLSPFYIYYMTDDLVYLLGYIIIIPIAGVTLSLSFLLSLMLFVYLYD